MAHGGDLGDHTDAESLRHSRQIPNLGSHIVSDTWSLFERGWVVSTYRLNGKFRNREFTGLVYADFAIRDTIED